MTSTNSLLRLMSWLSPVFPTGGFSYSSGLEAAVQNDIVCNEADLEEWLRGNLTIGDLRNDAIFVAAAWHKNSEPDMLRQTAELALALAGSKERHFELTAQGKAFMKATQNWELSAQPNLPAPCPLTVALGAYAGAEKLELKATLAAYLHSVVTNQAQAAIRLSLIGQNSAASILAKLEPTIETVAEKSLNGDLNQLGSASINLNIMAMKHDELDGRMFQS